MADDETNDDTDTGSGSSNDSGANDTQPDNEEGWKRLQGMIDESVKGALKNWQPPVQTPAAGQSQGTTSPPKPRTRSQGLPKIGGVEKLLFGDNPPLRQSRQESRSQGKRSDSK